MYVRKNIYKMPGISCWWTSKNRRKRNEISRGGRERSSYQKRRYSSRNLHIRSGQLDEEILWNQLWFCLALTFCAKFKIFLPLWLLPFCLPQLCARQFEIFKRISNSVENLKRLGKEKVNKVNIELRLDTLRKNWNTFRENHRIILSQRYESTKNINYFTRDCYGLSEEGFLNSAAYMSTLLEERFRDFLNFFLQDSSLLSYIIFDILNWITCGTRRWHG